MILTHIQPKRKSVVHASYNQGTIPSIIFITNMCLLVAWCYICIFIN